MDDSNSKIKQENDNLGVKRTGKNKRTKPPLHPNVVIRHDSGDSIITVDKTDFKKLVQKLTGYQPKEGDSQVISTPKEIKNLPGHAQFPGQLLPPAPVPPVMPTLPLANSYNLPEHEQFPGQPLPPAPVPPVMPTLPLANSIDFPEHAQFPGQPLPPFPVPPVMPPLPLANSNDLPEHAQVPGQALPPAPFLPVMPPPLPLNYNDLTVPAQFVEQQLPEYPIPPVISPADPFSQILIDYPGLAYNPYLQNPMLNPSPDSPYMNYLQTTSTFNPSQDYSAYMGYSQIPNINPNHAGLLPYIPDLPTVDPFQSPSNFSTSLPPISPYNPLLSPGTQFSTTSPDLSVSPLVQPGTADPEPRTPPSPRLSCPFSPLEFLNIPSPRSKPE